MEPTLDAHYFRGTIEKMLRLAFLSINAGYFDDARRALKTIDDLDIELPKKVLDGIADLESRMR